MNMSYNYTRAAFVGFVLAALILSSGCTTNPFATFRTPEQLAGPIGEPVSPPSFPEKAPLVIEILDYDYPWEHLVLAAGLQDLAIGEMGSASHIRDAWKRRFDSAEGKAIYWNMIQSLVRTELAEVLQERFPDAVIIISAPSFKERLELARVLPNPVPMAYIPGVEFPAKPVADVVVQVRNRQGISGEDSNYAISSFGRYFGLLLYGYLPPDNIPFFTTQYSGLEAPKDYNRLMDGFNAPISDADINRTKRQIRQRHWSVKAQLVSHQLSREFFVNYSGTDELPDYLVEYLARMNRRPLSFRRMSQAVVTVPRDEFNAWEIGGATSPLHSLYAWLADGVATAAEPDKILESREKRYREWAARFESDEDVLLEFARNYALGEMPAGEKALALTRMFQVEKRFLQRLGEVVVIEPVKTELGDFILENLREQESRRVGFERRLIGANIVGFAGAGLAMGGVASAAVGQATVQAMQVNLVRGIELDRDIEQEMAQTIAEQIGALTLEIGGESIEVSAGRYEDLQTRLAEIYSRL